MKKFFKSDDGMYLILIGIMLVWGLLFLPVLCNAQNVQQQGNTFIAVKNQKSDKPQKIETPTTYYYQDTKGNKHQVFLSASGKAFIKYRAKTGEIKRRYMPEIGRKINPKAYKEK